MTKSASEMLFAVEGAAGRMRLNRPKALNALTHGMCTAMLERLAAWRTEPAVERVLIDHAPAPDGDPKGARGFCAGGDIRMLAESGAGDGVAARAFFAEEYRLNHLLFTFAKPVIAFMDGIVMGGGVGIAQPARFRIATERTVYAMPETGIGLFPDVGGGWYLSRLPGRIGEYLALTGARLEGSECLALGIATHYLPSAALEDVKTALSVAGSDIAAVLDAAAVAPGEAPILALREMIERLFAADTLEEILAALATDGSEWATQQHRILAIKSPQSCKVALSELARSRRFVDFADEMRMEYGIAAHVCQRHDFLEGVRALIVDRDNAPRWDPPTPEAVTGHLIDTIFAPLASDEAWEPYQV